MKQVEKVCIGGYAFTIEKDASALADRYVGELSDHYAKTDGGNEIMEGIEERMAELLLEKCGKDGVVTDADVNYVIGKLGRPEVIDSETSSAEKPQMGESSPGRKLYRDLENGKICGVCSGFASYFKIDVAVIRAAFIIVLLMCIFIPGRHVFIVRALFPVAIYLVLAFSMPVARTVSDKCRQRGEGETVRDIQKNVKGYISEAGAEIGKIGRSDSLRNLGRFLQTFFGILLLLAGVAGIFTGFLYMFENNLFGLYASKGYVMDYIGRWFPAFASATGMAWVKGLILLAYHLPFIGMLYGSVLMIFDFKSPKWHPGLIMFIVWLIAIVMLSVLFAICMNNAAIWR